MTAEERLKLEQGLFKQPFKEEIKEMVMVEHKIKIAPTKQPFLFCWWGDYLGCEIEVFENLNKDFFSTVAEFDNFGFIKQCNIPKNCCQVI